MDVFVYGTLQWAPLHKVVAGCTLTSEPATLRGFSVSSVVDDVVPTISKAPAATAKGLLLRDVPQAALARLDLFETAWWYRPMTVTVQVGGQDVTAQMYEPPLSQESDGYAWRLDAWVTGHGRQMELIAQELFSRDPLPDAAALRALWPMAARRSHARVAAESRTGQPATVRFNPAPQDVDIVSKKPFRGEFFGLQQFELTHRQFDASTSDLLQREVFMGIDAALVLPYDPKTDRVLLVEQMRAAPAILGDPNPWVLEPIAGMIDVGETPAQAARREADEEAGLTDLDLLHIASFYPSPGASTDYFHAYLGLCTLSGPDTYTGGLYDENEDLRLHIMTRARAMDLLESGEITAGPLMLMLHWLAARYGSFA